MSEATATYVYCVVQSPGSPDLGRFWRNLREGVVCVTFHSKDDLIARGADPALINDPGYRLVAACIAAGAPVSCLPGPSAVTTALAVSGLPSDRFCF